MQICAYVGFTGHGSVSSPPDSVLAQINAVANSSQMYMEQRTIYGSWILTTAPTHPVGIFDYSNDGYDLAS